MREPKDADGIISRRFTYATRRIQAAQSTHTRRALSGLLLHSAGTPVGACSVAQRCDNPRRSYERGVSAGLWRRRGSPLWRRSGKRPAIRARSGAKVVAAVAGVGDQTHGLTAPCKNERSAVDPVQRKGRKDSTGGPTPVNTHPVIETTDGFEPRFPTRFPALSSSVRLRTGSFSSAISSAIRRFQHCAADATQTAWNSVREAIYATDSPSSRASRWRRLRSVLTQPQASRCAGKTIACHAHDAFESFSDGSIISEPIGNIQN